MNKNPPIPSLGVSSCSFRAQLNESNTLVSSLTAETDHLSHDRKTSYQHGKQLEELRNLQVGGVVCLLCVQSFVHRLVRSLVRSFVRSLVCVVLKFNSVFSFSHHSGKFAINVTS